MSDLIENLNGNISTQAGNSLLDFNKINVKMLLFIELEVLKVSKKYFYC